MPKMTGSRAFAEMMQGYGVTHVFFVPAIMLKSLAEMENMDIRRIMTHGEKSAAYMADGYARASGRPGVCMAQHIGASNLAAGLRDAFMACAPVIAITGGPTPVSRYRYAYQEVEDIWQFDPVTKLNVCVDHVTRLPDLLRQAFRACNHRHAPPGPFEVARPARPGCRGRSRLAASCREAVSLVPAFRPGPELERVRDAAVLMMPKQINPSSSREAG